MIDPRTITHPRAAASEAGIRTARVGRSGSDEGGVTGLDLPTAIGTSCVQMDFRSIGFALLLHTACSNPTTNPAQDAGPDSGSTTACATLPAGTTIVPGGTACTSKSGLWSALTIDTVKQTYSVVCDQPEATLYQDQSDFDANEGSSGAAGITIVSHEDFVRTATCSSGSIDYTTPTDPKTTVLFLWTKQP